MLVSGVLLGLVAGLAIGRDVRRFDRLRVRWLPVLIGSLALRALAPLVPAIGFPLYVGALAGTSISAAVNMRLVGTGLIAVGGFLNLVVVLANGGMPVDAAALAIAGAQMPQDTLHLVLDGSTRLAGLSDVIPLPLLRGVYSVGDVIIAAGGFLLPFLILVRR